MTQTSEAAQPVASSPEGPLVATPDASIATRDASNDPPSGRTSEVLRGILTKNPRARTFSVRRILSSIGTHRIETALVVLSTPAIVPVPVDRGVVPLSTGALACQLVAGRRRFRLPSFILNKAVSRRALAVAIHAVVPLLEATEKVVRPRWSWVDHPNARRAIGLLIFVLALAIAEPFLGLNALHATAVLVMSLGMAEHDGLAVLVGVAVGVSSLVMLAASWLSAQAARARVTAWLRKVARRVGLRALAAFLTRRGYEKLAAVLSLRWGDLLLLWNPEKSRSADPAIRKGDIEAQSRGSGHGSRRSRGEDRFSPTSLGSVPLRPARAA